MLLLSLSLFFGLLPLGNIHISPSNNPTTQLQEEDKVWKFESLLQDVAQDINKELEASRLVSKAVEEDEFNDI